MAAPTLIYCAGKNRRFDMIAVEAGYLLGAQLPDASVYFPIHFADQNWKKPDRERYIRALAEYQPYMASVLDWERPEQLDEVLSWAEEAAQFVRTVMIIPKVPSGISLLPRMIGGKPVRLGYSVPTKHGGTMLPVWEFAGWTVHLLGGSPHAQMKLIHYLDVASADGNMPNLMATRFGCYWSAEKVKGDHWVHLPKQTDAPYEAFRRSCENIMTAWRKI